MTKTLLCLIALVSSLLLTGCFSVENGVLKNADAVAPFETISTQYKRGNIELDAKFIRIDNFYHFVERRRAQKKDVFSTGLMYLWPLKKNYYFVHLRYAYEDPDSPITLRNGILAFEKNRAFLFTECNKHIENAKKAGASVINDIFETSCVFPSLEQLTNFSKHLRRNQVAKGRVIRFRKTFAKNKSIIEGCSNADADRSIDGCSKLINRGNSLTPEALSWVHQTRAASYEKKGNRKQALADYNKAIRLNSKNKSAFVNLGNLHLASNQYDEAISSYGRAIALDSSYAWAYARRGYVYSQKKEYEVAISDYDKAIKSSPRYSWALAQRGDAYRLKGQYDRAIADFDKAIEIIPNNAWALAIRGLSYRKKGDYDRAIADLSKAIEINPNDPWDWNTRGEAYYQKGEYDRAIKDYNKAIELNSKYTKAYANRGWAHLKNQSLMQAETDFRKALELEPKNRFAKNGLKELELAAARPQSSPQETSKSQPQTDVERKMELVFWNSVRTSKDPVMLKLYLDKYPHGIFAELARSMMKREGKR